MDRTQTMRAAIFDMDGTLIDSMPAWRNLNAEFIRSHGMTLTPEQEQELYSLTGTQVIPYFKEHFGLESDFETLCAMACRSMAFIRSMIRRLSRR